MNETNKENDHEHELARYHQAHCVPVRTGRNRSCRRTLLLKKRAAWALPCWRSQGQRLAAVCWRSLCYPNAGELDVACGLEPGTKLDRPQRESACRRPACPSQHRAAAGNARPQGHGAVQLWRSARVLSPQCARWPMFLALAIQPLPRWACKGLPWAESMHLANAAGRRCRG